MSRRNRFTPQVLGRLFAGWLLVLSGGMLTPLPIPVGLLVLSLGLALLAHDSRWMRHQLRRLRGRYPVLSDRLAGMGRHAPRWLARVIRRTAPRNRSQL